MSHDLDGCRRQTMKAGRDRIFAVAFALALLAMNSVDIIY
jgi:hypothetical protein